MLAGTIATTPWSQPTNAICEATERTSFETPGEKLPALQDMTRLVPGLPRRVRCGTDR